MPGIFRGSRTRASRAAIALMALAGSGLACSRHGSAGSSSFNRAASPISPLPLAHAAVLGTSGLPPADTTVTFLGGTPRTIMLLHAPPGAFPFVELVFPAGAFAADSGREVTVRLRARPRVYGLEIETSSPIGPGATVTFKYPRYFAAPPEARGYTSDVAFERALVVAQLRPDSTLVSLPSVRPTVDNLMAPLPSAGTYLVVAPVVRP